MPYPTTITPFVYKRNNVDKVIADDINLAYTDIIEIERQLGEGGVTVSTWGTGTFTSSTSNWYSSGGLKSRLQNIEAGLYQALVTGNIKGTTIPSSKTLVVTTDKLSVHAATTSAELKGVISDETGSGALVFGTAPTLGSVVLSAGSNTVPPLKLTSGTLVTSPASGAVEYNGNFFATNANVSNKPAIVSTPYYVSLSTADYSIGYLATPSPAFAGTSITLDVGLYEFETLILFKKSSSGANNISMTFGILGGATVSLVSFSEELYKRTTNSSYVFDAQAFTAISNTPTLRYSATSGTLNAKNFTRSEGTDQNGYFCGYYKAKGFFKVVVPGTFWIEASYSGAPSVTAASVAVGSFCKVIPMDSNSSAWA
jgi:hypothetical protein